MILPGIPYLLIVTSSRGEKWHLSLFEMPNRKARNGISRFFVFLSWWCDENEVPLPLDMKYRILFVCHGNICRSPMAEFVMKDLVKKAGLADSFVIESAATSTEEIGNTVYPPARRKLAEHGIGCAGKTARQMTRSDYNRFDLLIGMDSWNIRNMRNICGGDPEDKIKMLMDYTHRPGDVADPWYTGDFEATWRDVLEGCQQLLAELTV